MTILIQQYIAAPGSLLAEIAVDHPRQARLLFPECPALRRNLHRRAGQGRHLTNGHSLSDSGRNASAAGIVASVS